MPDAREAAIRQNYSFFKGVVSSMMDQHSGKYALIHDCELIGVFETAGDAVAQGNRKFGDGPFSVQRVINRPIDLGFLSHATDNGISV